MSLSFNAIGDTEADMGDSDAVALLLLLNVGRLLLLLPIILALDFCAILFGISGETTVGVLMLTGDVDDNKGEDIIGVAVVVVDVVAILFRLLVVGVSFF